jgi:hypothetical protein
MVNTVLSRTFISYLSTLESSKYRRLERGGQGRIEEGGVVEEDTVG